MPRFLSSEWAIAAARALDTVTLAEPVSVTVAHLVHGTPEGDLTWVVKVHDGRVSVALRPGLDAGDAEIVFVEDYATACALARGDVTAEQAVAAGRLKLRTGTRILVSHAGALRAVGEALQRLHAETTW